MVRRNIAVLLGCVCCFYSFVSTGSSYAQESSPLGWKEELQQIDAEIKRLQDEQIRLKLSAARWDDTGNRWQFQQNMTQEAKRAFQKADDARAEMKINDQHLQALEARRAKILEEHPGADAP